MTAGSLEIGASSSIHRSERAPASAFRLNAVEYLDVIEVVAHDIRNPLAVIWEYLSLMREGAVGSVSDDQLKVLDILCIRAHEIHLLVESLQTASKLACDRVEVNRKRCSIEDLLGEIVPWLKEMSLARYVTTESRASHPVPDALSDPLLTRQVLVSLWWWTVRVSPAHSTVLLEVTDDASVSQVSFRVSNGAVRRVLRQPTHADWILRVAENLVWLMDGTLVPLDELGGFECRLPKSSKSDMQTQELSDIGRCTNDSES